MNAVIEYVDERGQVIARERFYDPGLDEGSWYAREMKERKLWRHPHLAFNCGAILPA